MFATDAVFLFLFFLCTTNTHYYYYHNYHQQRHYYRTRNNKFKPGDKVEVWVSASGIESEGWWNATVLEYYSGTDQYRVDWGKDHGQYFCAASDVVEQAW